MIHIIKKSKKTTRENKMSMHVSQAKEYLYCLDKKNFLVDDIFVFSADTPEELDEILGYFSPHYLELYPYDDLFDGYRVNPEIQKINRTRLGGASVKSIDNFKKKLLDLLPNSSITVLYNKLTFEMRITARGETVKLICTYQLEIEKVLIIYNNNGIDANVTQEIIGTVNKLFKKQRYYYRRKAKQNEKARK